MGVIRRLLDISENTDCDCGRRLTKEITTHQYSPSEMGVLKMNYSIALEKETNESREHHTEYTGNHTEMCKRMVVFPNVKGHSDTKEQRL